MGSSCQDGQQAPGDRARGLPINLSLAEARNKARETREAIAKGVDPVAEKQAAKAALLALKAVLKTFEWCARTYVAERRANGRTREASAQWLAAGNLRFPDHQQKLSVQSSLLAHVLGVLNQPPQADKDKAPLWDARPNSKPFAGQVEVVNWASVHSYRDGLNPARWKGHLDAILKAPNKIQKNRTPQGHPYTEMNPIHEGATPAKKAQEPLPLDCHPLPRSGGTRGQCVGRVEPEERAMDDPRRTWQSGQAAHRAAVRCPASDCSGD